MTTIIPNGYGQVTHHFALAGSVKSFSWSHGYLFTGVSDAPGNAEALALAAKASTGPYAAAHMVAGWTYLGTTTIENEAGDMNLGADGVSVTGTNFGLPLVPNTAILVKKATGLGGRKNQGRAFVPPCYPGEGLVNGLGTIDPDSVTEMQGYYTDYYTTIVALPLIPVILHSAAGTPTVINGFLVQSTVATQRRRLR